MNSHPARSQGHFLGFTVSALLHLGLLLAVLAGGRTPGEAIREGEGQPVPVSLAMFQSAAQETAEVAPAEQPREEAPAVPEPAPGSEAQPQPEAVREPEPELVEQSEPAPSPSAKPKPKPESQPKPEPKPKPKPKPKPRPKSKPEPKAEPKPATTAQAPAATRAEATTSAAQSAGDKAGAGAQPSAPDKASIAALERQYLEGLRRAIEKHKFFPKRARRRGDEGQALVAFAVEADGRISHVKIRRSSGTKLLDKAAVEALEKLARYQPIPEALQRRRWELRVPINFALE